MIFRRLFSYLIDFILIIPISVLPLVLSFVFFDEYMDAPAGQPPTPLMLAGLLWFALSIFGYFPLFECSPMRATPGKFLAGLKVVQSTGERLSFIQAFYRMAFGPLAVWFIPGKRAEFSGGARVVRR
jgi:uncharacterized RDD family membrane protein YckC